MEIERMTMDVPKSLRAAIRISAARNGRGLAEEVTTQLEEVYGLKRTEDGDGYVNDPMKV